MKYHKFIIIGMIVWHFFISLFAFYHLCVRYKLSWGPDVVLSIWNESNNAFVPITETISKDFSFYVNSYITPYLWLISIMAIISGIFLIVNKKWGRIFSIVFGSLLIPFGFILLADVGTITWGYISVLQKIVYYFSYLVDNLNYIALICICYGIFLIVYFTRTGVINYLKIQYKKVRREIGPIQDTQQTNI
jgi:hypothetical protein